MKLLPGVTVADRLKQATPISQRDKLEILRQISMTAIHSAGIIPRNHSALFADAYL